VSVPHTRSAKKLRPLKPSQVVPFAVGCEGSSFGACASTTARMVPNADLPLQGVARCRQTGLRRYEVDLRHYERPKPTVLPIRSPPSNVAAFNADPRQANESIQVQNRRGDREGVPRVAGSRSSKRYQPQYQVMHALRPADSRPSEFRFADDPGTCVGCPGSCPSWRTARG